MSQRGIDLDALAAKVARELARADEVAVRRESAPSFALPHAVSAPAPSAVATASPGVRYVRDNARIAEFIDHSVFIAVQEFRDMRQVGGAALVEHHGERIDR